MVEAAAPINIAPGVWNINEHYNFVKAGEWTGF